MHAVAKPRGASPPPSILAILLTKHEHTYKLHEICQFGQFIFGKIIKIVATKSHLLKLKCTKFDFGCGSAQTPLGELSALPRPFSRILGGPTSKEKEKRKRGGNRGREGKGKREGERRRGTKRKRGDRERETRPPIEISGYATACTLQCGRNLME